MSHRLLEEVRSRGNLGLLQKRTLALFCSVRCPGALILRTYDFVRAIDTRDLAVAGGFHSPMERECLTLLLRARQPVIICPARSIERMRVPSEWRQPLNEDELLLLSPFDAGQRRTTAEIAAARNRFVASLADEIVVAYAAPGSKTEAFCKELLDQGKRVLTFDSLYNAQLISWGAEVIQAE